jgi:hypothetical protein
MLTLDIKLGYGRRMKPKLWWEGERETLSYFMRNFLSALKLFR